MKKLNNKFTLLLILTMMSMMGLIASDIYIPGLNTIAKDLNASVNDVQLTIGVYLLGLSLFQLVYGPLSDRLGRKPVILFGFFIYTVASIFAIYANSIEQLIIVRFIQACGACSGLVVGRAIISDLYSREESAHVYNFIYPLVAASPAIAPLIGGYIIEYLGWRYSFLFIFLFGGVLLTITSISFKESNVNVDSKEYKISDIIGDYLSIVRNGQFWKYTLCVLMLYGTWFTFLTQASFIYHDMGYTEKQIGYFYIPLALMIYVGSRISKFMSGRVGIESTFFLGLVIFCFGALVLFVTCQFTHVTAAAQLIIPMALLATSNGIVLTLGISSAVSLNAEKSGSASAVVGCLQIGFSSLCASMWGYFFDITPAAMAAEILSLSLVAFLGYLTIHKLTAKVAEV
ncbi:MULTISPECIES: multidrug effflux MFS transporter [Vibrio]|uniref:multidrug effflux MFS transporter n=1 Tax=Vibrio TaxID=662 RepID=UPI00207579B0|nr:MULTISPECIES: multidrug effflux MFS transporter [Vibrio]USD34639.1 multidrug effflux MFS transporter [Vibrio sp. SCSIO 43186]USD47706.1 multidrug effflux MFS transporter [Vibrio sp. SCSIO 43145]USD71764.1 multidrug effflux MFS transporter [Vibrio sp. SCSIO 43139]USD98667.1 hypothetical protein CTT30_21915 [Vibrio coralliilyticus]